MSGGFIGAYLTYLEIEKKRSSITKAVGANEIKNAKIIEKALAESRRNLTSSLSSIEKGQTTKSRPSSFNDDEEDNNIVLNNGEIDSEERSIEIKVKKEPTTKFHGIIIVGVCYLPPLSLSLTISLLFFPFTFSVLDKSSCLLFSGTRKWKIDTSNYDC